MPFDFQEPLADLEKAAGRRDRTTISSGRWRNGRPRSIRASAKRKYAVRPESRHQGLARHHRPQTLARSGPDEPSRARLVSARDLDVPEPGAARTCPWGCPSSTTLTLSGSTARWSAAQQIPGSNRDLSHRRRLVRPGKNLLVVAICEQGPGPGGFCSGPPNMLIRAGDQPRAATCCRPGGTWKAKATVSQGPGGPVPTPQVGHYKTITGLYNGMIAPLTPFAIKGALWYQGEANGPCWLQYRRLLPTLIADWRSAVRGGRFPVPDRVAGQLQRRSRQKPIEPGWAEIRESQWRNGAAACRTPAWP